MANETKIKAVEELTDLVNAYKVVGILNMHKMPAKQLFDIRNALRGEAKIRMAKSSLIKRAFEASKKAGGPVQIKQFVRFQLGELAAG